jgi:hypothetical protein
MNCYYYWQGRCEYYGNCCEQNPECKGKKKEEIKNE